MARGFGHKYANSPRAWTAPCNGCTNTAPGCCGLDRVETLKEKAHGPQHAMARADRAGRGRSLCALRRCHGRNAAAQVAQIRHRPGAASQAIAGLESKLRSTG